MEQLDSKHEQAQTILILFLLLLRLFGTATMEKEISARRENINLTTAQTKPAQPLL